MLKVRLQRVGRKNNPSFRVVVVDSKHGPKSGNYIEIVGSHNPCTKETAIKDDRIKHWIGVGAKTSPTVHNILVKEKVIDGKAVNVLPKKSPIVKETEEAIEAGGGEEKGDTAEGGTEAPEESSPSTTEDKTKEPLDATRDDSEESPEESKDTTTESDPPLKED